MGKYRGVYFRKDLRKYFVKVSGKHYGYFNTEDKAIKVADKLLAALGKIPNKLKKLVKIQPL